MKNLYLHNVDILEKNKALNKWYIANRDDFEILRWPYVTLNDLWGHKSFYKIVSL